MQLLRNSGLQPGEGKYSVRVQACEHFVFQHLGGDVEPTIDADGENPESLSKDANLVSAALAAAGIRHRFEVCDSNDKLVNYIHFNWPEER